MLVLRRKSGQWTEITHRSGDVLRVRVYHAFPGHVDLVFDDDPHNFEVNRPERERVHPVAEGVNDR